MAKWFHLAGLYLFWPALAFICWAELTPQPPSLEHDVWDKSLHFWAYFGLGGLISLALQRRDRVAWATLALIAAGGALEIIQGFVGRDPSFFDELANTLGATSGAATGWLILRLLRPKNLARPGST